MCINACVHVCMGTAETQSESFVAAVPVQDLRMHITAKNTDSNTRDNQSRQPDA